MGRVFAACLILIVTGQGLASRKAGKKVQSHVDANAVNDQNLTEIVRLGASPAAIVRCQILLDRANFSPGEIDGNYGSNLRKAISAFQSSRAVSVTGETGPAEWQLLNADPSAALIPYTITAADLKGPFVTVPDDMMKKSKLPALGYESALEAIAEYFHASPRLLRRVNPNASFRTAGEEILVPNVVTAPPPPASRIIIDKSDLSVTAVDSEGKVITRYPAAIGSHRDPLPIGTWKINGVGRNPVFHYNPRLFWDAEPSHSKAKIPPGPNNPVGVVWIDLSKKHYGIHGTPDPNAVGKTQSHGCIRLTNWDAVELAAIVTPGLPAILQE
jgi:lipoprotein-anchoring transpeptidase ErfK/SrfK